MTNHGPAQTALPRILLAEPDTEARSRLKYLLDRTGYEVTDCHRPIDLWVLLHCAAKGEPSLDFQLVICNVRMLDEVAMETIKGLQDRHHFPPLMLVGTPLHRELHFLLRQLDCVAALDQPFDIRNQLARIREIASHRERMGT